MLNITRKYVLTNIGYTVLGSARAALPPEGGVYDLHINCIWKGPQQEQGLNGVNNSIDTCLSVSGR